MQSPKPHQLEPVPEHYRQFIEGHGKSPWHPSIKATSRVPDPVPRPSVCNYCGGPVEVRHHTEVYGKEYSDWPWLYRCTSCDAMVGMHPFTSIPLGTLATKELRDLRKACKQPFEVLWQSGQMSRTDAYANLAIAIGVPVSQCHFGLFDAGRCRMARDWAVSQLRRAA